jgi:hypothetical protein
MAMMLGALYRALISAHVHEDEARTAAEEVAAYDTRLASMEARLTLLTWMVGFLLAMALGNLWLTLNVLSRLPR